MTVADSIDVKAFITDEDPLVRVFATDYYTKSYSEDHQVMERIMASIDAYGLDSFRYEIPQFGRLPQSPESVAWVLEQLRLAKPKDPCLGSLNRLLVTMPWQLIVPRLDEVASITNIQGETKRILQQRRGLVELTTDGLWQQFIEFTSKSEGKYVTDIDWNYAKQLVAELAGRDDLAEGLVLDILSDQEAEGGYLVICSAMIAGRRKMDDAVPLLIDQVAIEGDLLCEEGVQALVRIGTEAVVDQVAERFPSESEHFQVYAANVFADVRHAKAPEYARSLLGSVKDEFAHIHLLEALCWSLTDRYLSEAYELIVQGRYASFIQDLRQPLYCAAKIIGCDFPEQDAWRRQLEEEEERIADLQTTFFPQPVERDPKIGRNQPCPCGSGKKYKKCCLKGK